MDENSPGPCGQGGNLWKLRDMYVESDTHCSRVNTCVSGNTHSAFLGTDSRGPTLYRFKVKPKKRAKPVH